MLPMVCRDRCQRYLKTATVTRNPVSFPLSCPPSFPEICPLVLGFCMDSEVPSLASALWNMRGQAHGEGDLRKMVWKGWELFVFWKHIFFCRLMAIEFCAMATVGSPNIATSRLEPYTMLAINLPSSFHRRVLSSGKGFCLNSAVFPHSKVKSPFMCKHGGILKSITRTFRRVQSEFLGAFQARRYHFVTDKWAAKFIFTEEG